MNDVNLKIMGQKEKDFEDSLKQLTEKMEADTARLKTEQEKIFTNKLQVIPCDVIVFSLNDQ